MQNCRQYSLHHAFCETDYLVAFVNPTYVDSTWTVSLSTDRCSLGYRTLVLTLRVEPEWLNLPIKMSTGSRFQNYDVERPLPRYLSGNTKPEHQQETQPGCPATSVTSAQLSGGLIDSQASQSHLGSAAFSRCLMCWARVKSESRLNWCYLAPQLRLIGIRCLIIFRLLYNSRGFSFLSGLNILQTSS